MAFFPSGSRIESQVIVHGNQQNIAGDSYNFAPGVNVHFHQNPSLPEGEYSIFACLISVTIVLLYSIYIYIHVYIRKSQPGK